MFKFILKKNIQGHPLLYLSGVSSQNIGFILDYIYYGEVNIYQEHLDSFLESAQKLEISGLIGGNEERKETDDLPISKNQTYVGKISTMSEEEEMVISNDKCSRLVTTSDSEDVGVTVKQRRQYSIAQTTDAPRIHVGNMTPEEIEAKRTELYQKIDGMWTCLQCGKTTTGMRTSGIRDHVETHLDGLCYTCNMCSKEFGSKNSLRVHKTTYHK